MIFDNGYKDSDDSDDSNAETYWRNEYPDTSDSENSTDDEVIKPAKQGFIHCIDATNDCGSESNLDLIDIRFEEMKSRLAEHDSGFNFDDVDCEDIC